MFAKIKHLAIISDNYTLLSRFYQALFGMKSSKSPRPESAIAIGDGYIGMNIIPQKLGRQAGLNILVWKSKTWEKVAARLREKYPSVQLVKRPIPTARSQESAPMIRTVTSSIYPSSK